MVIKNVLEPIKKGFFATDIYLGSRDGKHKIYIVGVETYEEMRKEKFKGIHFLKFDTEQSVPWEK